MRLLTITACMLHLRAANWHAVQGEALLEQYKAGRTTIAERVLVGSIVVLGIACLWLWLAGRPA